MSLINKMLQDLESRKDTPAPVIPEKSAYDGLRSVKISAARSSGRWPIMVLALLAVAVSSVFAWKQWGSDLSLERGHARASKAQATATRKASKPVERVSAETPAATGTAPAPLAEVSTSAPGSTGSGEPSNVAAKSVAAPVAAEPAKEEPKVNEVSSTLATHVAPSGPSPKRSTTSVKKPRVKAVASAKTAPRIASAGEEAESDAARVDKKITPLTPEQQAESGYRQAANLLQQGRKTDAEQNLRSALAAHPGHIKARELLAGLELQNGRWREAQQDLEQGLAKVPAYYPFAQLLARVYVEHGSDQKALAVMESSRQAGASNADFMAF
ncbi:MAG: tetratricopeptide repeat protein, partial [Pseudomonadota bacterium]